MWTSYFVVFSLVQASYLFLWKVLLLFHISLLLLMLWAENIFHISAPKHSETTGMLQGPCLSTQTHLMKVLQREQALWNPLLKALRLFLWPLGLPWLRICSCFPITECSGTCGTSTRSFQGAAGLGSAWYPGFLLCRGCWVGVAAAILQVSKLHLFSFLILSPHNFLSACCSPAQRGLYLLICDKSDSKNILKRSPLPLFLPNQIQKSCLPLCFASCCELFLSPSALFYSITLWVKEMIKDLEQLV